MLNRKVGFAPNSRHAQRLSTCLKRARIGHPDDLPKRSANDQKQSLDHYQAAGTNLLKFLVALVCLGAIIQRLLVLTY